MPNKVRFFPYGPSNSLKILTGLVKNGLILKRVNSKYRNRHNHLVVNWGSSACPSNLRGCRVLNAFENVAVAISKTRTFETLREANVPIPDFTYNRAEADNWALAGRVIGRDLDTGRSGRGITVYERGSVINDHRFYVKYWRKQREFRVHVFDGKVIFEQEKLKKRGVENADKYVRSHGRGWCFAFNHLRDTPVPETVREISVVAVKTLGLDFGAVDIGWNDRSGAAVFEVNTAPGIEESSAQAYAKAINGRLS